MLGPSRMADHLPKSAQQMWVVAGGQACCNLAGGQAVAGHRTLEQVASALVVEFR